MLSGRMCWSPKRAKNCMIHVGFGVELHGVVPCTQMQGQGSAVNKTASSKRYNSSSSTTESSKNASRPHHHNHYQGILLSLVQLKIHAHFSTCRWSSDPEVDSPDIYEPRPGSSLFGVHVA